MSSSSSGPSRQQQLHDQLHSTRLQIQQHHQQLYGLLPPPSELGHNVSSYSPTSGPLPPIPSPHHTQRLQQANYFPEHHGNSGQQQPNAWRTSSSRDEPLIPLLHHPLPPKHPQPQSQPPPPPQQPPRLAPAPSQPVKRENMTDKAGPSSHRSSEDPMPSTSDFVKKLYKMLEDPSFQSVVSWGPQGDCFVVKDMNEFTKSILPRMFKHSNFASFVRQLNKYDFHKVKNTDDNQFGEHSWTFRHPDFHADRRDALENIKRKVPAQRKSAPAPAHGSAPYPPSSAAASHSASGRRSPSPGTHQQLLAEIQSLKEEGDDLKARIRSLERNYESVLVEMVGFQRGMAQQDGLMQSLIAYFLGSEGGKPRGANNGPAPSSTTHPPGASTAPTSSAPTSATATGPPGHHLHGFQQQQQRGGPQPGTPTVGVPPHHGQQPCSASHHHSLSQGGGQPSASSSNPNPSSTLGGSQQIQGQPSTPGIPGQGPTPVQQLQQHLAAQREQQARSLGPLSSGTDPNPFLPQQTMQRLVGSGYLGGQQQQQQQQHPQAQQSQGYGMSTGTPDLGRATLMQMNEFSRRAGGYLKQQQQRGEGNNLWTGMNYSSNGGDGDGANGSSQSQQPPKSRAEWLAQLREYQKERWGAPPPLPSQQQQQQQQQQARGRSVSADRGGYGEEYGPSSVDDDARGRGRERRRRSEGGTVSVDRYNASVLRQQEDQARQAGVGSSSVTPSGGSNDPSGSTPGFRPPMPVNLDSMDAWAQMMSNTSQQFNFNAYSGTSGAGGDEDSAAGHEGLQVYTVGHLMPRNTFVDDNQGGWSFNPTSLQASTSQQGARSSQGGQPGDTGSGSGDEGSTNDGDNDDDEVVRPTLTNPPTTGGVSDLAASSSSPSGSTASPSSSGGVPTEIITPGAQKLRVRRSTFVPGWAVPPRVLLVDDDAVSRKLSTKFLKVFGCTTDVAVDGVGAVNKMNLEKYDLVLMDIVMPKLDGVSATNLIRKFDQGTPIISMTSNSKPNEIMTYYSSGMNDILPKPFTKDGLLDMLEKHLTHLKVISQLQRVPPQMGILPPLNDAGFEQALTAGASQLALGGTQPSNLLPAPPSSQFSSSSSSQQDSNGVANAPSPFNFNFLQSSGNGTAIDDDGRINPLAGMGLTDEQYNLILQNIVNGEGFMGIGGMEDGSNGVSQQGGGGGSGGEKRPLEDPTVDDREGKRGRFESIE